MNVLVVNIGSTSFKFRLLDMETERAIATGGVEGVGAAESKITWHAAGAEPVVTQRPVADQGQAVQMCLDNLATMSSGKPPFDAVGFKAVHGGHIAEPARIDSDVLATMEAFADAAPAHNPPYVAAMRSFQQLMPDMPLVAAFETGFHQTIPASRSTYAIPHEWTTECGVRRYGFHGASHRYVSQRAAALLNRNDLRIVSCHLGGSSSVCAIKSGRSLASSFGMTPQSGLPQNNRVGDFDAYALLQLRTRTGLDYDTLLARMSKEGGLLGISGLSNDMQAIVEAAGAGHERAELALSVFVQSVRDYIGAYIVALGGIDVLIFTAGIGHRASEVRRRVCDGLGFLGIELDDVRNKTQGDEVLISADDSAVKILILETNEELIVARQTRDVLLN